MLTTGGMTGRLDQLEKFGLIRRVDDPGDRRILFAEMTEAGSALIDELIVSHLEFQAEILAALPEHERAALAASLRGVEASLRTAVAGGLDE